MSSRGSYQPLLTNEEIARIPIVNELPHGECCTICLREFQKTNAAAKQLPCNHCFHEECLVPWLKVKNTCPTCRHQLGVDRRLENVLNQIYDGYFDDVDGDDVVVIESDDDDDDYFGDLENMNAEHDDDLMNLEEHTSDSDIEIIEE